MRRFAALVTIVALSTVFAVALVELGLRAGGYRAWTSFHTNPIVPMLQDPDTELGWVLRPGHWRYGPYVPSGTPIEVTILPDRSRRTGTIDAAAGRPQALLLGCSFTFGWAVSDDETFAWRLQSRRPDLDVRNRGTGAYGTLQSLLLLERLLANGERPAHVVYGFIPEHAARNVAAQSWFWVMGAFSGQNIATLPYATLDASGHTVRHAPVAYPAWPLREWSAAVTLLQDRWVGFAARARAAEADEVTRQLVAQMDERCRSLGIPFSLLLLKVGPGKRDAIVPFARARGIDVIDCDQEMRPADFVPGDVHPNGRLHGAWGDCLADALGT